MSVRLKSIYIISHRRVALTFERLVKARDEWERVSKCEDEVEDSDRRSEQEVTSVSKSYRAGIRYDVQCYLYVSMLPFYIFLYSRIHSRPLKHKFELTNDFRFQNKLQDQNFASPMCLFSKGSYSFLTRGTKKRLLNLIEGQGLQSQSQNKWLCWFEKTGDQNPIHLVVSSFDII